MHRFSAKGHNKKRHLHATQKVSFTYNPGAPFGLELGAERLMAERERRRHLLKYVRGFLFLIVEIVEKSQRVVAFWILVLSLHSLTDHYAHQSLDLHLLLPYTPFSKGHMYSFLREEVWVG
jgi:hypothetical protein